MIMKQRSALEVPDDSSATPSGHFHGTLLPKWYHQAMDDDHNNDAPALPTIPSAFVLESPATQEVRAFLSECGLEKHLDALLASGFDSMESLQHAEDEHFEKVGLPLGHRLLLMRKLKPMMKPQKTCVLDDEAATAGIFDSLDMQRFRQRYRQSLGRADDET
jgi:hypothetical protein